MAVDLPNFRQASFYGTSANSAELDQTLQNAASGPVVHYLLTECTFKI